MSDTLPGANIITVQAVSQLESLVISQFKVKLKPNPLLVSPTAGGCSEQD